MAVRTLTLARHNQKCLFSYRRQATRLVQDGRDWNGLRVVAVLLGGTDLVTLSVSVYLTQPYRPRC